MTEHPDATAPRYTPFRLDRSKLKRHLERSQRQRGLAACGDTPASQIAQAVKLALAVDAVLPRDQALPAVIASTRTELAIAVLDLTPSDAQMHARATAGLPCYRHIGCWRQTRELTTVSPRNTFDGMCEAIGHVLAAANELLPALAALHLGEVHTFSLIAQPLRVLTYNLRARLSTETCGVSDLAQDDPERTIELWPLLIEALETGEAAEDWDGDRQRTLLLRTGGATALAQQMNAARAALVHVGAVADGVLPDPQGGFARHIP